MPRFDAGKLERILKGLPNVTTTITPEGRKFMAQLADVSKGPYVAVGVTQEKFDLPKEDEDGSALNGYTLGEIAVVHEFGSKDGHIPERSFLRVPSATYGREMLAYIKKLHKQVLAGKMTAEVALGRIGLKFENIVRNRIRSNIPPGLKDATLRQKTRDGKVGNVALVDTGQLLNSISSQVVMDGNS